MIAYKGFTENLWSKHGNGEKETCSFKIGETKTVDESKTVRSGFHCCENPFECLTYYAFDGKNRFFKVLAAGDIDEDENERIACTQITLLEELTPVRFAMEGLKYMIHHPQRNNWEQSYESVQVRQNKASAKKEGHIAIARGRDPHVRGPEGSILGLLVEKDGEILNAKLIRVEPIYADKWLRLTEERKVEIIEKGKG